MALFLLWYPSLVHFCFFFIPPIFNHPQTPSPPNLISNYFCSCSFSHLVLADQKIVNKAVCWVHFCEYSETVRPELCRCNIEVQTFTLWSYVMITVKKKNNWYCLWLYLQSFLMKVFRFIKHINVLFLFCWVDGYMVVMVSPFIYVINYLLIYYHGCENVSSVALKCSPKACATSSRVGCSVVLKLCLISL